MIDLYIEKLENKKIAVIANNTSIVRSKNSSIHLIDTLIKRGIKINKIFSPEHGFLGDKDDGEKIENGYYKSIKILSLYGKNRKINDDDIKDIDILIFDIQDVGVRFYTYLSTLHYAMESVSRTNKKLIILDPVPIVYGMTIGEYGKMINGEGWLENGLKADLEIIKIKNYNHKSKYEPSLRPSPNLPNLQSIYLYPSLAFLEKTEVSVGRGTKTQFQIYGHPDFEGKFSFIPQSNFGSQNPKLKGIKSNGEDLRNYKTKNRIELKWLINSYNQFKDKNKFFRSDFDKLAGSSSLKKQIIKGVSESEIRDSWKDDIEIFKKIRKKYLLY